MIVSLLCLAGLAGFLHWQKTRGSPLPKKLVRVLLLIECLGLVLSVGDLIHSHFLAEDTVKRPEYGEGAKTYEFTVKSGKKRLTYEGKTAERRLSSAEIQKKFSQAEKEIDTSLAGENKSLSKVERDLKPRSSYVDGWVAASWRFEPKDLIKNDGTVLNAGIEKTEVIGQVELTCQETKVTLEYPLVLYPADPGETAGLRKILDQAWSDAEDKSSDQKKMKLPLKAGKQKVFWYAKDSGRGRNLSILGFITAFVLTFAGMAEKKRRKDQYLEAMREDYPGILNMLFLYVQSGITTRGAMERIGRTYLAGREKGKEKRPGYELLLMTIREMESGTGEQKAYEHMGSRAGERSFRKLSLLLTQNLARGTGDLLVHLEREAREAREESKNRVRSEGEKISTRLLLPMMLLMGVVLAILIFPAMYGIQTGMFGG